MCFWEWKVEDFNMMKTLKINIMFRQKKKNKTLLFWKKRAIVISRCIGLVDKCIILTNRQLQLMNCTLSAHSVIVTNLIAHQTEIQKCVANTFLTSVSILFISVFTFKCDVNTWSYKLFILILFCVCVKVLPLLP